MSENIILWLAVIVLIAFAIAVSAWENRLRAENHHLRALLKLAESVNGLRDAMDRRGVPPAPTVKGGSHD